LRYRFGGIIARPQGRDDFTSDRSTLPPAPRSRLRCWGPELMPFRYRIGYSYSLFKDALERHETRA
jgi:hypothetical protein